MPQTRIALAGATGNLGTPILAALLASNFPVTVLSRINGTSSKLHPHPNLTIKQVDFTSIHSLIPALQGIQVVVSCFATSAIGSQNPLIDAAVSAGVKRFIPAEFGMDSRNARCVELPVCAPKAATQKYLLEKSKRKPGFTYTAIANGLFLDWDHSGLGQHTATLYNGGDVFFSATLLVDVAKAVVGVVEHQAETVNRVVYVHSALVTQNQLIKYANEEDGQGWKTIVKDTEEVRQESLAELGKGSGGDIDAAMLGFCICGSFASDYGCDFSGHLDNELLGIKEMGEVELRTLVEAFL